MCQSLIKQETNEENVLEISIAFCIFGYNHCHLFFFFHFLQFVLTGEKVGSKRLSL